MSVQVLFTMARRMCCLVAHLARGRDSMAGLNTAGQLARAV